MTVYLSQKVRIVHLLFCTREKLANYSPWSKSDPASVLLVVCLIAMLILCVYKDAYWLEVNEWKRCYASLTLIEDRITINIGQSKF